MTDDLFGTAPPAKRGRCTLPPTTTAASPYTPPTPPRPATPPPPPPIERERDARWKRNYGKCPEEAKGKRVAVELANGRICGEVPVNTDSKLGWNADGMLPPRWKILNDPFDIAWYRVL